MFRLLKVNALCKLCAPYTNEPNQSGLFNFFGKLHRLTRENLFLDIWVLRWFLTMDVVLWPWDGGGKFLKLGGSGKV